MDFQYLRLAICATIAIIFTSYAAIAFPGSQIKEAFTPIQNSIMGEGQTTTAPFGHIVFCSYHPQHCRKQSRRGSVKTKKGRVKFTKARWKELVSINASVNQNIIPRTDRRQHGKEELWSLPTRYGDCEDYALEKRRQLLRKGWPTSALRIAVVITPKNERHAILVAKTTKGDYTLDNLTSRIKLWNRTGFRWIKQQSAYNPKQWVTVTQIKHTKKVRKRKKQRRYSSKRKRTNKSWQRISKAKKQRLSALWKK